MKEKVIKVKKEKVRDAWVYVWQNRDISERKAEIIKEVKTIQKENFVIEEKYTTDLNIVVLMGRIPQRKV